MINITDQVDQDWYLRGHLGSLSHESYIKLIWTVISAITKRAEYVYNSKIFFRYFVVSLMLFITTARADVLENILDRGTMRVGVSLFAPWTIQDEAGELTGVEIDVANKLAMDMGVKPEYKINVWEEIIPAIMKGEVDLIAGGMAITPERALKINFSQPYADSGISLVTNTDKTRDIKRLDELNQKSINIAVVSKTASSELAPHLFNKCKIMIFDTAKEAE